MRGTYHLCFSSHDEVLYRNQEDFDYAFNCFAIAVVDTGARALCESFQSTHLHNLVQCDDPKHFSHIERYAYSRYFNSKYHRRGRVGEKSYFVTRINGIVQTTVCSSYILRQNLHHGVSATVFDNPNCSINCFFRKDLGRILKPDLIPDEQRYLHLPKGVSLSPSYRMNSSGLLVRDDIIDTAYVEELYMTARNFLFQMNRKSGEEWEKQQLEADPKSAVITLKDIENVDETRVKQMFLNESGRVNNSSMTDVDLCQLIDNQYVRLYTKSDGATIYDIPPDKRTALGNRLYEDIKSKKIVKYASVEQIRRCAVI